MPSFDIVKEVNPDETFRVNSIINNFDIIPSYNGEFKEI